MKALVSAWALALLTSAAVQARGLPGEPTPPDAPPSAASPEGGTERPTAATQIDPASASPAVRRFYALKGHAAWTAADADALAGAVGQAGRNGMDPQPLLAILKAAGSHTSRDRALTRAALVYARALSQGVSDPEKVFDLYTIGRNHVDLATGLQGALKRGDVGGWLEGLAPQDADYQAISAAYLAAVRQSSEPAPPPIPGGPTLRPGDTDARIPQIVAALRAAGFGAATADLSQAAAAQSADSAPEPAQPAPDGRETWTSQLADALKAYQSAHALAADGIVGPGTLAMLNQTPADRARRLAVNLERRRWTPRAPAATRIDVNTAAATLTYVQDGQPTWSARVVPGRAHWATPMLQASFSRLVVNPPWNVPADIAAKEITPKGPAYLASHHMRRVGGRIVQSPGPWAALGRVKFDMVDRDAIYLHDTPEKSAFDRSQRHLSHGCVRVEGAVSFARRLAAQSGRGDAFDAMLASGKTGVVALDQPIEVRLLYRTATVDQGGAVTLSPDVYGWDAELATALGMGGTSAEGDDAAAPVTLGP